jgi:hypothetical protein
MNINDDKESLLKMIESLTSRGYDHLDPSLVKDIKNICKKSDQLVETAAYCLLSLLKKKHSQVN